MFNTLLDGVFPPRKSEYVARKTTVEMVESYIAPKLIEHTSPNTLGILPFKNSVVRDLVHECKYYGNRKATKLLSHALSAFLYEYLVEHADFLGPKIIFVPMPVSKTRKRERGYNQVERILTLSDIQYESVLYKCIDTPSQLTRSRKERVAISSGVFKAGVVDTETTHILIDDVVTTGATMQAAIDALGNSSIVPIALAY